MSAQQQAIIVQSPKAPFVLGSDDIPVPAKGEVLLKIMTVALNPANWIQRELNILIDVYPAVLGNDMAGVIEQVGEGVEGWKKGDKVFGKAMKGGFRQYTAVAANDLMAIPESMSFDEVATVPVAFTTACAGLFAGLGLGLNPTFSWDKSHEGESALVIGGATSLGQFAIQLLKFLGFTRIIVYASRTHFGYLKELGATEFVDRAEVTVDSLAIYGVLTPPVNVVYHAVDPSALNAAYDCVAEGGGLVTAQPQAPLDRDTAVKKVKFSRMMPSEEGFKQLHIFEKLIRENLPKMLEKKVILPNRYEVLANGVTGILGGLDRLQHGSVSGVKLVAHPQDPAA
ncbi:chaperonin 10-like protein [Mycena vitilis]|nr:chaperonin 10-like protein [Mycena vitilis]